MWRIVLLVSVMVSIIIGCESGRGGSSESSNSNGGSGGSGGGDIYALYPDLPPDPGSEGKKTLEGIDSNNNGVRDDVEIAIYKRFPEPEKAEQRATLLQGAKARQKNLEAGARGDINEILKVERESARSIECLVKKFYGLNGSGNSSEEQHKFLTNSVVNTKDRTKAHMLFSKALSGRTFSGSGDPMPCDSDREKESKAQAAFNAKTFNVQTAYNLPPDPGEAGKATLEGIDSNNNGVRDDVEIAIYNYAPRPDQERYRAALMQRAKAKQRTLIDPPTNDDIVASNFKDILRSDNCLWLASPRRDRADHSFIDKILFNTSERKQVNNIYQQAIVISPKITSMSIANDPNPCDYDRLKQ